MPSLLRTRHKSQKAAPKSEFDSSISTSSTSHLGISEIRSQELSSLQLDASITSRPQMGPSQPSNASVTSLDPQPEGIVEPQPTDLWARAYNDLLDDQEVCYLLNVNCGSLVNNRNFCLREYFVQIRLPRSGSLTCLIDRPKNY